METLLTGNLILKTDFSQVNVIDSSEKQKSYLVITETGKHLRVSQASYRLLEDFDKGVEPEKIAEKFNVSVEKVVSSYDSLTARIRELDKNDSSRRSGFWFLWEIIPGKIVSRVAKPLSLMFHPAIAILSCLLIISGIFFNVQAGTFSASFSALQNPQAFWIGYFLFFLSTVAHELGHAGASARYGATPSGIGFTVYLIFPALYSDVTNSWKLKSGQRAVVGLGGIYFQLICAAFYSLLGFAFGSDAFKIAVLMIFGNCILNLNPFFKFDGYWILSDLLGVVNLSSQPKRIFLHFYSRLKGAETTGNLPWSGWISSFVVFYSVASVFVVSFFIFAYSSSFWAGIQRYPATFKDFFIKILGGDSIGWQEIHAFFLSSVTLVVFSYFIYNIVLKPLFTKLRVISGR